jgi:1-acyl-sn-glycerol-3-phosphate acyltransferase
MQKIALKIVYSFLVRWFLKLIVGVKFDNAKFLLNETQFIILANHNSHLDTMTLLASLPSRIIHKVKPVAAGDHFGKTKLKGKLTEFFVNALLIKRGRDRGNSANDPINKMIKALDSGYSLILFPEGTRGEPEIDEPLKKGIGLILEQRPKIKFVTAYMKGMGKAMPKNDNLIVPFNSTLIYGKPTQVINNNVSEIMNQIENEFTKLRIKTTANNV